MTLAATWPLGAGLGRYIPQDLGDPLLNCWILAWNAHRLLQVLGGNVQALSGFWDANIFHPEPLALAYSEHLFVQSVEILPLYSLTGDIVLCYNVLFLSTFALSALGMYLLVRELTGSGRAGLVAGLLYGFALYRVDQLSHIQTLSSQWMPFALFGLRRFFETRRWTALAGATVALVAQNLSCGYFLFFFAPFLLAYALWEMGRRRLLGDGRTWASLALAGTAASAATVPFLLPYLELRGHGALLRSLGEVQSFSADVFAYLSAPEGLRLWGSRLRLYPGPESCLFPGIAPLALAAAGIMAGVAACWRAVEGGHSSWCEAREPARRALLAVASVAGVTHVLLVLALMLGARDVLREALGGRPVSVTRALQVAGLAAAAALALSARARAFARAAWRTPVAFFAAAAPVAFWLSLGPTVRTLGQPVGSPSLYGWLYDHVPGFDGLRVPARFGMLFSLFTAVLAGFGALELLRRARAGRVLLAAATALFVVESTAAPLVVYDVWREPELPRFPPEPQGFEPPEIYRAVQRLPPESVLAEFPFGTPTYDVYYMFYSTRHWLRLVNGTSGGYPASYQRRSRLLGNPLPRPDAAWSELVASGATHAVVHEAAWRMKRRGQRVTRWLEERGARPLARSGGDVLLELP